MKFRNGSDVDLYVHMVKDLANTNGFTCRIDADACSITTRVFKYDNEIGLTINLLECPLTISEIYQATLEWCQSHNLLSKNFIDCTFYEKYKEKDVMNNKKFTKKDLKNGDVIKRRDGSVQIICLETGTCICQTGNHYDRLKALNDDLIMAYNKDGDVIAVRRPLQPHHCCFDAFELEFGELVYERKEVEEMTLAEVCKALGKEIKIVKEK